MLRCDARHKSRVVEGVGTHASSSSLDGLMVESSIVALAHEHVKLLSLFPLHSHLLHGQRRRAQANPPVQVNMLVSSLFPLFFNGYWRGNQADGNTLGNIEQLERLQVTTHLGRPFQPCVVLGNDRGTGHFPVREVEEPGPSPRLEDLKNGGLQPHPKVLYRPFMPCQLNGIAHRSDLHHRHHDARRQVQLLAFSFRELPGEPNTSFQPCALLRHQLPRTNFPVWRVHVPHLSALSLQCPQTEQ
mmetsp:Transcript_28060/g.74142  ORF Transcript_28060/g.74142 Transcript_28060/m.74142 type:complete len:244 (-) Transcript_28060:265-996(-)